MSPGGLFFAISALMLSCIDAAPHAQASPDLASRDLVNILVPTILPVYFCTEPFWQGTCDNLQNGPALCIKLSETFAGKASSIGPDKNATACDFYQNDHCSSEEGLKLELKWPGVDNLPVLPRAGKFDNSIRSYTCY
ncbi:uncharacterized protein RCC_11446 [Ramularia collo-cygni]|uniref:Uncharacterized protein n=1 Tax=Ramularia collo-cygni TaxID=112498 RepID=A0A2D3VJN4_9PEZI|nr:uncharacterized protein RCC_11446 [Ramularia collo-cygni]CZT25777.1 uncharacterized protein RCC_11446 [Ramularia collo-cygni]